MSANRVSGGQPKETDDATTSTTAARSGNGPWGHPSRLGKPDGVSPQLAADHGAAAGDPARLCPARRGDQRAELDDRPAAPQHGLAYGEPGRRLRLLHGAH